MIGHRRGLEHLTVSLRAGAKANRRRVRLPLLRVRRFTMLHYRKRPIRLPWLVDPVTMELVRATPPRT